MLQGWLRRYWIGVMILGIVLPGCRSSSELVSPWRDQDVVVDGRVDDWSRPMALEADGAGIRLTNDATYLYVNLTTADAALQRQILGRGFTVWFDPAGGKEKIFGLQYPLGWAERGEPGGLGRMRGGGPGLGPGRGPEGMNPDVIDEMLEQMVELDVLGPDGEERQRVLLDDAFGISARLRRDGDRLVYELRVPIRMSDEHPFAIGGMPGEQVGVGFETPELDRDALREEMGERGGGLGGPGGAMPPGGVVGQRGGRGMGMRSSIPEPLRIWTLVSLASSETTAPGP